MTNDPGFDFQGQTVLGNQTIIGKADKVVLGSESHARPIPPKQIPQPPTDFKGRDDDLRDLLNWFDRGATITGLRVGIYLMTMRGEYVFTSFDTDDPDQFNQMSERKAGHYVSRCTIPADMLNEGRYAIGVNASVFRVKRYFQDANAVVFNVNPTGAPGMHWPELRQGVTRPRLDWEIVEL